MWNFVTVKRFDIQFSYVQFLYSDIKAPKTPWFLYTDKQILFLTGRYLLLQIK